MTIETKRLFFGLEAEAPWPVEYPQGRLIHEKFRHVTLAFLGNVSYSQTMKLLPTFPLPSFKLGLAGLCDKLLFLPHRHPHVVSYHVTWPHTEALIKNYHQKIKDWLRQNNYSVEEREFTPHITVCRSPFDNRAWEKTFSVIPCTFSKIHLYESVGNLQYECRWTHHLQPPCEEIEHTADIAYNIFGETISQIHFNAQIALAFRYPELTPFLVSLDKLNDLEDIVISLNEIVTAADAAIGCPFKAVSFHGKLMETTPGILKWEMIVDV